MQLSVKKAFPSVFGWFHAMAEYWHPLVGSRGRVHGFVGFWALFLAPFPPNSARLPREVGFVQKLFAASRAWRMLIFHLLAH